MKKIFKKSHLDSLEEYPVEVKESIKEIIETLNDNYGENRDVDKDLGGYIILIETLNDLGTLQKKRVKDIEPEYIDIIESNNGSYSKSLYLLSSDYVIMVYILEILKSV